MSLIKFAPASPEDQKKGVIATAKVPAGTTLTRKAVSEALDKHLSPPKVGPITVTIPRGRPTTGKAKKAVTIRLDPDILEALEARGDWRTEVNAVLRTHLNL